MDEVVKLVQEKAGLGEDQARQAVETVVGYLKQKLPAPIAAQVDSVLASDQAAGALRAGADRLGGLLGKGKK